MAPSDEAGESVWRWPPPLGLLWLVIPVVGMTLRAGFGLVSPHDYWWQLAFGRMIAETGTIPSTNLFLYTMPADASFVDQPWLAQWTMYRLVEQFGHAGPYLLRAGLTAGVWTGLVWLARRRCRDARAVGAVAIVAVVASAAVFSVRSRMFALPLYVGALGVVVTVADRRLSPGWLALLVPIVALWVNLHGSFVLVALLVAVVGGALTLERWLEGGEALWRGCIPWLAAGLGVVAAGTAHPFGAEIYAYVGDIAFSPRVTATVTEWQPPEVGSSFGAFVYAAVLAGVLLLAVRRKKAHLWEVVLYAATAYLAVDSVRAVFWWAAAAAVVLPRHLAGLLPAREGPRAEPTRLQGLIHATAALALVGAAVAIQPGMPGFRWRSALLADKARQASPGAHLLSNRNPLELVERLRNNEVAGRIFHDQAVGGLLDHRLGAAEPSRPRQVAFVDQRMGLIPPAVWAEYFAISRTGEGWRRKLRDREIAALLLYEDDQQPLIEAADGSDRWRRVAEEAKYVLFRRR